MNNMRNEIYSNKVFLYLTTKHSIEDTLSPTNIPIMRLEAQDAVWIVSDIMITPKSEDFLIYSTLSGVLKIIGNFDHNIRTCRLEKG
jgi:hypothetical protein